MTGATILILAPHTDDGELGAGASIVKWVEAGNDVHYVAFTACETVQPESRAKDILRTECRASTQVLGVPEANLSILDFEVRQFPRDRQPVLDALIQLNTRLRPDLILTPSSDDTHQDHSVVSAESRRAFKRSRLLGYESPWNHSRFENTAYVQLDESHVERKWESLQQYGSQADRPYMTRDHVWSQVRFRGVQAGLPAAEAFQVLRWYL